MNAIIQFMKKHFKILLAVVGLSIGLLSWNSYTTVKGDPEKDKLLLELLAYVIEHAHYNPAPIDDAFSKGVYKDYISALDPSKRFFLQSDIDEFAKYETQIDDQILNKDLTFFDLTYSRMTQRMEESKAYYKEILATPFDYSVDESIDTDYEKLPYAKDVTALKERWRKQVKLSTLSSYVDKQKFEEDKIKNKGKSKEERLAEYKEKVGRKVTPEMEKKFLESYVKETTEAPKSNEQIEKETRESTL